MTLNEFYKELGKHDWYYDWSDDHSVWNAGQKNVERLQQTAQESEAHQELYQAFYEHKFSGQAFGNVQQPKPKEPKNETKH